MYSTIVFTLVLSTCWPCFIWSTCTRTCTCTLRVRVHVRKYVPEYIWESVHVCKRVHVRVRMRVYTSRFYDRHQQTRNCCKSSLYSIYYSYFWAKNNNKNSTKKKKMTRTCGINRGWKTIIVDCNISCLTKMLRCNLEYYTKLACVRSLSIHFKQAFETSIRIHVYSLHFT